MLLFYELNSIVCQSGGIEFVLQNCNSALSPPSAIRPRPIQVVSLQVVYLQVVSLRLDQQVFIVQ